MNPEDARRTTVAVFLLIAGVVVWENLQTRHSPLPSGKKTVQLLVLAAGLAIGVEIVPELAGPLALLIGVAFAASRLGSPTGYFRKTYTAPPTTKPGFSEAPSTKTGGEFA